MIFIKINVIMLIEPLIECEPDYTALGMNFEHISFTLYYIKRTNTFISLLTNKHFHI